MKPLPPRKVSFQIRAVAIRTLEGRKTTYVVSSFPFWTGLSKTESLSRFTKRRCISTSNIKMRNRHLAWRHVRCALWLFNWTPHPALIGAVSFVRSWRNSGLMNLRNYLSRASASSNTPQKPNIKRVSKASHSQAKAERILPAYKCICRIRRKSRSWGKAL
jgi:hypothetical protein